ncbi:hypothetical protein [Limnospira sp. Paracas R14]|nr:hypothetical protein [Limnospira sp. Paracas R14]
MSTPLLLSIGGGLRYPNPPYEGVGCVNEMSTPLTNENVNEMSTPFIITMSGVERSHFVPHFPTVGINP